MDRIQRIKDNIFPGAWAAIENWEKFKWHKGAHQRHSSQALAIDFFGTLKKSKECVSILNHLAKRINLPASESWEVELEWRDRDNILRESPRAKTQVDAVASSDSSLIFFECKFTERDGGSCSQPGHGECNGNYEDQVNPVNHVHSKCALVGKGIRYWEVVPQIFHFDPANEYRPCPFAGSWYQWMRNVVVCSDVAKKRRRTPRVLIIYMDSPGLAMAENVKLGKIDEFKKILQDDKQLVDSVSYQELLKISLEAVKGEKKRFLELEEWMNHKITSTSK